MTLRRSQLTPAPRRSRPSSSDLRAPSAGPSVRLYSVALPAADATSPARAPILFPVPFSAAPEAAFHAYLDALAAAEAASAAALLALKTSGATYQPIERGPAPLVGLLSSAPEHLTARPGARPGVEWALGLVAALGTIPFVVPPRLDLALSPNAQKRGRQLKAFVSALDGIIGLGGADVHPRAYGQEIRHAVDVNWARDSAEIELASAAMSAQVYMFGICRSHQLWNVAAGGRLIQDIQAEGFTSVPHDHGPTGAGGGHEHRVLLRKDSRAARILGNVDSVLTNSRHHQAVLTPGSGFEVAGRVRDPSTAHELIEITESDRALTVQFHPEDMVGDAGAAALISAFGRRSRVLHTLRYLESRGEHPTLQGLEREIRVSQIPFEASDLHWVRTDVARGLGRSSSNEHGRTGGRGRGVAPLDATR